MFYEKKVKVKKTNPSELVKKIWDLEINGVSLRKEEVNRPFKAFKDFDENDIADDAPSLLEKQVEMTNEAFTDAIDELIEFDNQNEKEIIMKDELRKVIGFMKKNKTSGIWLENGQLTMLRDSSNGYSEGFKISSLTFNFLQSMFLLKNNSYSGFKYIRIFDSNIEQCALSEEQLINKFNTYIKRIKQELIFVKTEMNNILNIFFEKNTKKCFIENIKKNKIQSVDIIPPKNYYTGYIKVSNRKIHYLSWDIKKIKEGVKKEIDIIDNMLKNNDFNEMVFCDDFSRAPLPYHYEKQLNNMLG